MDRSPAANRALYGSAYLGLSLGLILLHIMPTDIGPDGYPGPDLMLCVTFAWVLRRPQYVPTLLIAAVFLLTDILFMRPPGLWTALVVVAVEALRARESVLREQPVAVELGTVAAVLILLHLADWLLLLLFGVPQAQFGPVFLQAISTAVAYPMVVVLSRLVFKVQKMSPVEYDATRRGAR
ncbi:rod shape-determining protein MreD [Psychromarinibacter sp. C21-152]|uniref:Rod shape-determining protein MreD n=1 Tax=Psychromarinibacter sediminicola TaxID=3033385 RepID=A0AAE3NPH7_9RHOB|nr:rod shape-determining protein MreD [Psychromarinibacter sediminicola]MDF0601788.1 rod shape-determining protein MreD [Psychromarinibacter sediminicola]